MFGDYTKLVLQDYETKKAAGLLPLNLSKPTPARIREECLIVCKGRFQRKDEMMLRDFFRQADNDAGYLRIIKRCAIDRFRPLINFIKKPTIRTDEKNVELLAWLIDFKERPFEFDRKYPERLEIGNEPAENDEKRAEPMTLAARYEEKETERFAINPTRQVSVKPGPDLKTIATFIVVLLVLAGILIYKNARKESSAGNGASCMYWAGDHYQPIPCSQKVYGTLVVALDSQKLLHFKKITKPDTLTEADVDKVFYIKYNGAIEFYTGRGEHPVYTERSLKPLTEYMYIKYILPLKQQ